MNNKEKEHKPKLLAKGSVQKKNEDKEILKGIVIEALPNIMFRVELENGEEMIAYLSGKMKFHRIRILVGDRVEILIDPYGGKGRLVKRL